MAAYSEVKWLELYKCRFTTVKMSSGSACKNDLRWDWQNERAKPRQSGALKWPLFTPTCQHMHVRQTDTDIAVILSCYKFVL